MKKKIISISLITAFLMGTVGCASTTGDVKDDKEVINDEIGDKSEYIIHSGKISEVIKDGDYLAILVDDEGSSRGAIKFNITEETSLVSDKEDVVTKEELTKGTLVEVSYGKDQPMTNSLPPMTNAVIVTVKEVEEGIEDEEDLEDLGGDSINKITYQGEEIILENEIYESEGTSMIPMREVGEKLGYEASWNAEANQAELIKESNMVTATLNEDMYSFAKMIVKLGKASEVKDGVTFVPVSFLDEVMQLDVEKTEDGTINIK